MKLKIADIEMNGEDGLATIGATHACAAARPASSDLAASSPLELLGLRLPSWPARSYWALSAAGTAAAMTAGLICLLAPLALIPAMALLAVIPSLAGAAIVSAIVAKRISRPGPAPIAHNDVLQRRASKIAALLGSVAEPVSVERIMDSLQWTEVAVVTGLRCLVDKGLVREDLDTETGHWTYELLESIDDHDSRRAMPVAMREAALLAESRGSSIHRSKEKYWRQWK